MSKSVLNLTMIYSQAFICVSLRLSNSRILRYYKFNTSIFWTLIGHYSWCSLCLSTKWPFGMFNVYGYIYLILSHGEFWYKMADSFLVGGHLSTVIKCYVVTWLNDLWRFKIRWRLSYCFNVIKASSCTSYIPSLWVHQTSTLVLLV